MLDQVVPLLPLWDARAPDDQWNVGAFVVKELLAPGGEFDPVVGEEYDQGVFKDTFRALPMTCPTSPVGYFDGIEVSGPVAKNDGVVWIVGWQRDFFHEGWAASRIGFAFVSPKPGRSLCDAPCNLPPWSWTCMKKADRFAVGPVMAVVHLDLPIEVVVGFAPSLFGCGKTAEIVFFQSTSDTSEIACFLKKLRNG